MRSERWLTATATASPTRRNSSPLRLSLRAPAAPTRTIPPATGKTYRIDYTDDLTSHQWHPLTDPIPGDGKPVLVVDPAAATRPQRFYRLMVVP